MRTANDLRKLVLPGLAATALMATSAAAFAAAATPVLNYSSFTTYATQAITASTTVTAPGTTLYSSVPITTANTAKTAVVTFKLPSGFTFSQFPTPSCVIATTVGGTVATAAGETCSAAVFGVSPIGATTTDIQITYTTVAADCTNATVATTCIANVSIAPFTFTNAGTLSSATTTNLQISGSSTAPDLIGAETPGKAHNADFAASTSGLLFAAITSNAGAGPLVIDIATTGVLGKKFLQNALNSTTGDAGQLTIGLNVAKKADGAANFDFGGSAGSLTLTGNFNNITSAFLAKSGQNNCSSSTSSVSTGTLSGGTATFPNITLPLAGGANVVTEVCLVANGTGVIGNNKTTAPAASLTVSTTTATATGALDTYDFNGSVQPILFSGIVTGYPMFLRVVNNSGAAATVTALFQSEGTATAAGIVTSTPVVTNLPAGGNTLVAVTSLLTAAGAPEGRVSLQTLAPSTSVLVSNLLFNPTGVFTQIGSGQSP